MQGKPCKSLKVRNYRMLQIHNTRLLEAVTEEAVLNTLRSAETKRTKERWTTAIVKAAALLREGTLENLEFKHETSTLTFHSPTEEIYTSNGTCGCPAYIHGQQPCYHRAMARLCKRYFEREQNEELLKCDNPVCGWQGLAKELIVEGRKSSEPTERCPKCESTEIYTEPAATATAEIKRLPAMRAAAIGGTSH